MGQGIDRHVEHVLIANTQLQSGISLNPPQALGRASRLLQRRLQRRPRGLRNTHHHAGTTFCKQQPLQASRTWDTQLSAAACSHRHFSHGHQQATIGDIVSSTDLTSANA